MVIQLLNIKIYKRYINNISVNYNSESRLVTARKSTFPFKVIRISCHYCNSILGLNFIIHLNHNLYMIKFLTPLDPINCIESSFYCTTTKSKCIPWLWVCDGDADCADRSDEATKLCGWLSKISFHKVLLPKLS